MKFSRIRTAAWEMKSPCPPLAVGRNDTFHLENGSERRF